MLNCCSTLSVRECMHCAANIPLATPLHYQSVGARFCWSAHVLSMEVLNVAAGLLGLFWYIVMTVQLQCFAPECAGRHTTPPSSR